MPNFDDQDEIVDISAILNVIWRRKFLISLISLVFIIIGGYYAYRVAVPKYRSSTVVILDAKMNAFNDIQSVVGGLTGDSEEVNTEVEVLRSRRLIGKVVDRLNLIEDPEFNADLRPAGYIDQAKALVKNMLGLNASSPEHSEEIRQQITRDRVIQSLLNNVNIRNVPSSLVFQITVETQSALKSAKIADTIADLYILDQLTVKFEETEKATTWLTERVAQLQLELETAESAVSEFSSSIDLVSVEVLRAQEVQLKELRERIAETEAQITADSDRIAAAQSTGTDAATLATLFGDAQLLSLQPRLDTDTGAKAQFDARIALLTASLQEATLRRTSQLDALRTSEVKLTRQLGSQSEDLIRLQQLRREAEAVRLLYEYFLSRLKEISAQQGTQQADSRVLSPAVIPTYPASPNKPIILIVSLFLGGLVGVGLVLAHESRQNVFRSARELEQKFGYSVLGQIPMAPWRNRSRVLQYMTSNTTSALAEGFRDLRTSITMLNAESPPQVVMNTSALPAEGKTTNSVGIAHYMANGDQKVLLMEGDFRRRTLDSYFTEMPKEHGVVSVINGLAELDDVLYFDEQANVWVLPGGKNQKMNAADVLTSESFKDLIQSLRDRFDVIIIDSPPVLAVPDARILSKLVDMTLFTIKWDSTSEYQVEEALRIFRTSGQRISGFVLGQIDMRRLQSYGKYGQYSAYTNYSGEYYSS